MHHRHHKSTNWCVPVACLIVQPYCHSPPTLMCHYPMSDHSVDYWYDSNDLPKKHWKLLDDVLTYLTANVSILYFFADVEGGCVDAIPILLPSLIRNVKFPNPVVHCVLYCSQHSDTLAEFEWVVMDSPGCRSSSPPLLYSHGLHPVPVHETRAHQ